MKALALLVVAACALIGCDGDSSSAADHSGVAADRRDVFPKALSQVQSAPASGIPVREPNMVGGLPTGVATPTQGIAEMRAASADEAASQATSGADALQNVNAATAVAPTMVIRNGQAFIEVDKIDPAILRIRQLTAQLGGYITNSSISGGRDQIRQATLEIKIPAPKYDQDSLIEFLKTLQVLPPGTKDLIVDENFKARPWPPKERP